MDPACAHDICAFTESQSYYSLQECLLLPITLEVTKACTISLVVDELIAPAEGQGGVTATGVKVDSSSKSPQTGVGMGAVAGVTVAMAAGAGATAFALRKRLSE